MHTKPTINFDVKQVIRGSHFRTTLACWHLWKLDILWATNTVVEARNFRGLLFIHLFYFMPSLGSASSKNHALK